MKIAYLGNHVPQHSTESHISATLESMGHQVDRLQENDVDIDMIVHTANQANLFLWTRTRGWLRCNGKEMLRRIRVTTASYHLDLYCKISRQLEIPNDPWWRTDVVFTPDGGSDAFWKEHRINHVYQKAGVFKPECYIPKVPLITDVVFVGSYGYHEEWPYRPRLVDYLRETYGDRFKKYGNPETTVRGDKLNHVYAGAKVVVGDTLCPGFDHPNYWSDRVYETLGRGGFLIHPWIKGMQEEFIDGVHLCYYEYGDFKELKRLIDYYVTHDKEREDIRLTGHYHVKENCTYDDRLQTALHKISQVSRGSGLVNYPPQPGPNINMEPQLAPELTDDDMPAILRKWAR